MTDRKARTNEPASSSGTRKRRTLARNTSAAAMIAPVPVKGEHLLHLCAKTAEFVIGFEARNLQKSVLFLVGFLPQIGY